MNTSSRFSAVLCTLIAILLLSACSSSSAPAPASTSVPTPTAGPTKTKIGFPAIPRGAAFRATLIADTGGLHDRSFNHLAWLGLRQAHQRFGITSTLVQSTAQSRYLPELIKAAQTYSTLTFAVGFGMGHALFTAAQEFPKARFAIIDGQPLDGSGQEASFPNVVNILFKEQESGYLAGALAGLMEKDRVGRAVHNTIGYLGGGDIPAVNHYLAGYVAGAQRVDPGITIIGEYATSFVDASAGSAIGSKQIAAGVDILFQAAAVTGLGYLDAARSQGVYGIGADADQSYLGPYILTSAIKKVSVAVRETILAAQHGRFSGGTHRLGLAQHATGFARPAEIVPASIVTQLKRIRHQIAVGTIVPPTAIPTH